MIHYTTEPRFSDLLRWERRYVLKHLTFKTGCLRTDLHRYDPPIAIAIARNGKAIGIAALLPADRRYKVKAHGIEVYVDTKFRNQGVAKELIRKLRIYADHERLRFWENVNFFSRVLSDVKKDGKRAWSGI